MIKSGIYLIKNKINNKVYVGQSNNFQNRKREHFNRLKNNNHTNEHLQKSWNKYGNENFEFIVLEECDINYLDEREIYWINYFNSTNNKFGYNLESGGHLNKKLSEETKRKISENHADFKLNPTNYKRVYCNGKIYVSIKDCSRDINIPDWLLNNFLIKKEKLNILEEAELSFYEEDKEYSFNKINNFEYKLKEELKERKRRIFKEKQLKIAKDNLELYKELGEKLGKNNLGRKHTEETKKKFSSMRKGENNSFYGKKHNLETKEKMSKNHGKAIKVSTIDGEFNSVKKMCEFYNIPITSMHRWLKEYKIPKNLEYLNIKILKK